MIDREKRFQGILKSPENAFATESEFPDLILQYLYTCTVAQTGVKTNTVILIGKNSFRNLQSVVYPQLGVYYDDVVLSLDFKIVNTFRKYFVDFCQAIVVVDGKSRLSPDC